MAGRQDEGGPGWNGKPQASLRVRCRVRQDEAGFNLVELLLVVIIMPLVIGAVAIAVMTSFQNETGLQARLSDSNDSITTTAYYVRDVQSAASVTTNPAPAAPGSCTDSRSPAPSFVLGLTWGAAPTVVSYGIWTPPPTPQVPTPSTQLIRFYCQGGVLRSTSVMSHNVTHLLTQPTLTCAPSFSNCRTTVSTSWVPAYEFSAIDLGVTQGPGSSGLQYSLLATPLTGQTITVAVPTAGPLLLLGSGTDIEFPFLASGNSVTVNGPIDLDSNVGAGNSAIDFQLLSFNNAVTSSGQNAAIDVNNCGPSCGSQAISNCCGASNTVSPAPVTSAYVPDPQQTWAQNNKPVVISANAPSCATSGSVKTCMPGRYPTGLTIPPNVTVNFGTGNYQFGTPSCSNCALTISGGDTVNFGSGVYTYEGGITVQGGGGTNNLCSGTVTAGVCHTNGGVLFYVAGGQAGFGDFTYGNKIQLSPMTSGTYQGILFWQDGSDNQSLYLVSGVGPQHLRRRVYAPNAQIYIYGFGNNLTTGHIVAQGLQMPLSFGCSLAVS